MSEDLEKKLMDLAKEGSDKLLNFLDDKGVKMHNFYHLEFGRKIVMERYGFSDTEFAAADFTFWVSYFAERESLDLIVEPEVLSGVNKNNLDFIVGCIQEERRNTLTKQIFTIYNSVASEQERRDALVEIVEGLYFSQKIGIMEKLYTHKDDPAIKMLRKIQNLRNHISHGRLNQLIYDGHHLSTGKGQVKMIVDIMNSLRKNPSP